MSTTTTTPVPTKVSREQYVAACTAFCEALGFNAHYAYFPMIADENSVTFPGVVLDADDGKILTGSIGSRHPQDDPAGVLSTKVRIEVEDA